MELKAHSIFCQMLWFYDFGWVPPHFSSKCNKKNDAIQAEKLNNHFTFIESVANVLKQQGFCCKCNLSFCLGISSCLKNGFALSTSGLPKRSKDKDMGFDITIADSCPPRASEKEVLVQRLWRWRSRVLEAILPN